MRGLHEIYQTIEFNYVDNEYLELDERESNIKNPNNSNI